MTVDGWLRVARQMETRRDEAAAAGNATLAAAWQARADEVLASIRNEED